MGIMLRLSTIIMEDMLNTTLELLPRSGIINAGISKSTLMIN